MTAFRFGVLVSVHLAFHLASSLQAAAQSPTESTPMAPSDTVRMTIDEAKHVALTRNLSILAARARLSATEADIVAAEMYPNPQISYNYTYFNPFVKPVDVNVAQSSIRLDQTIPLGGKRSARHDVAEFMTEASKFDLEQSIHLLTCDVKEAYIDVQYAERQLDIARKNLDLFRQLEAASKVRLEAGDIAEQDVTKIELENLSTNQSVVDAEEAVEDSRAKLYSILGLDRSVTLHLATDLTPTLAPLRDDSVVQIALTIRADIHAEEQRIKAAGRAVDLAHDGIVPDLDLGVELDKQGPDFKNYFGAGVGIAIPLFSRNQDEIQRSEANAHAAEYDMEALRKGVRIDVVSALAKYRNSLKSIQRLTPSIMPQADSMLSTSVKNYQAGHIGFLDLLESERIHSDAVTSYYTAIYKLTKHQIALERAVGRELIQ